MTQSDYAINVDELIATFGLFYDSRIRPNTTVPVTVSVRVTSLNYLVSGLFVRHNRRGYVCGDTVEHGYSELLSIRIITCTVRPQ